MTEIKVSLVIIQYGRFNLLKSLFESLVDYPDSDFIDEFVIVNNGVLAQHNREQLMAEYSSLGIQIVDNDAESYSSGVNQGFKATTGDVVIVSNNDVEWMKGYSVKPLVDRVQSKGIGVVGPQLVYPDGSWQRSHGQIPTLIGAVKSLMFVDSISKLFGRYRYQNDFQKSKDVDYVDGAFMVIDRLCFNDVGKFDEEFNFYGEESDFCYRARHAGWRCVHEPATRIKHIRGASSTKKEELESMESLSKSKYDLVEKHHTVAYLYFYVLLYILVQFERMVLYTVVAAISGSAEWVKRAERARTRWQAASNVTREKL